jgi:F-type H+-transporting ATPase subunit gamma
MPSLQSLRRKIAAVKNTQKITKAMKMVAAAKLKRAQDRILALRPYSHKLRGVMANLSTRVNRAAHPLLQKRGEKVIEVLVVTSDRGLCGAFNANILRKSMEVLREFESGGAKVSVSIVGRKGRDFLTRRPWTIRQNWIGFLDRLTFEHGVDIGGELSDAYAKGTFDELYVVYNEFKSAIQQRVIVEKLFPISADFLFGQGHEAAEGQAAGGSYLYEPDEDQLLEALLPKHVHTQVYRILLESFAAFYGAQMAAMDGATRNAGELIKKVTLYYNKTRQAAITKELMDIVGGAEALK